MTAELIASLAVGSGLGLTTRAWLSRRQQKTSLDEILDGPGAAPVPVASEAERPNPVVEATIGVAGRVVDRLDAGGALAGALHRARIPLRPGEYVVVTGAAGSVLAALLFSVTGQWVLGLLGLGLSTVVSTFVVRRRIAKRRKRFEAQLPGALTLIASSLSAGHTFLRAIQMMCEESDPPLAEEFSRLVAETRLGDPVVDALARMAERLQIRDLDWVVQAVRIQQTVGGRLADLLHTLADFIRSRDEVRREVDVLTAEGRISAYVLAALAPFLLVIIQIMNPGYLDPMYRGWGLVVLSMAGASVAGGTAVILRMVKSIEI